MIIFLLLTHIIFPEFGGSYTLIYIYMRTHAYFLRKKVIDGEGVHVRVFEKSVWREKGDYVYVCVL